jgi:rhodanese-related sulfurtransferase/DNA-binding CsgD family transcriptional regulator
MTPAPPGARSIHGKELLLVTSPSPKERLLEEFARIGKAVASPRRIDLLDLLAQGEKTVEDLAAAAGLSVKNTSAHLRTLREARLVETRRDGTFIHYRPAGPEVLRFVLALQELARRRLPAVDDITRRFYADPDGFEPVSGEELLRRMETGDVTVVDVRPRAEFAAGHIPGARSLPLGELETHLERLPADREIVAYCRGPHCMMSVEAVRLLRDRGLRARIMPEGIPEWKLRGHPVARGDEIPA